MLQRVISSLRLLALLAAAPLAAQAQTGNVGIGTTSPTQTLDVNGQLRVRGLSGTDTRLPMVLPDGTLGVNAPVFNTPATNTTYAIATTGTVGTGNDPYSVAVSGTTAYVVNFSGNTLQTFNVANSASPVLLATVATGANPFGVAVSGTTAYVVNASSNTLQTFNVANPAGPALLATVATGNTPVSVAVSGTTAYVVNGVSNTLQTFNVANPASPVPLGSVTTGAGPYSVAVSGTTAYVVNINGNTLQTFNVTNSASPMLLGSVGTGNNPYGVTVSGTTAYVVNNGSNTLQAFNVSTAASPVLLATVTTGSSPSSVSVSGTTAYVVNNGSNTLQAFNVKNPASPVLLATVATGFAPRGVTASSTAVYVTNEGDNTLQILTPSPPPSRVVTVNADGSLGSVALDFIQNSTTPQPNTDFNISGTGTVGGLLTAGSTAVKGNAAVSGNATVGGLLTAATAAVSGNAEVNGRLNIGATTAGSATALTPARLRLNSTSYEPKITLWEDSNISNQNHFGFGVTFNKLNYHVYGTSDSHVFWAGGLNGNGTELLRIQGNGNVGIGTPTPGQKLEVAGGIKFTGSGNALTFPDGSTQTTSAAAPNAILNQTTQQAASNFNISGNGSIGGSSTVTGNSSVGGSSTVTGSSSIGGSSTVTGSSSIGGNLGIGTSALAARLQVNGVALINGGSPVPTTTNATGLGWNSAYVGSNESEFYNYRGAGNGGFRFFCVPGTGTPTASNAVAQISNTGVYTSLSDRRVKTNIIPLAQGLRTVLALRPVSYDFHTSRQLKDGLVTFLADDKTVRALGFVAQDLYQVVPEAVEKPADDKKGFYAVSYTTLVPVLTQAIQEQQAQIEELKKQNAALKAQAATDKAQATATLETFEARLRQLEAGSAQAQR